MRSALEITAIIALTYFVMLNAIYLVFTAIAWHHISRYLRTRPYAASDEAFASPLTPAVSVLLPAFNEEPGIVESVRSLLNLRYPEHEVIVVNDGSTDGTLPRLQREFQLVRVRKAMRNSIPCAPVRATYVSRRYPQLFVIDKENGGKGDALNSAINAARYPYVCTVDADALLEEDGLLRVAKPVLDDPEIVVATGGIVRIANGCRIEDGRVLEVRLPRSRLASLQVVEYFRAFLVGRVAWSRLRSLLIISGAFGLFQRDAIEATGGYSTKTVGEDVELVLRLHRRMRRRGEQYRIEFIPDPVCWTEAPESLEGLARQRRRWQRGLTEALWHHRAMIGNPRFGSLGLLTLPYFLFLEVIGPLVELLGYLAVPLAVGLGALSTGFLLAFFAVAILLGILLSLSALVLEEFSFRRHTSSREVARMFALAVFENFGYRQMVAFWRIVAFTDLLRKPGWGEMRRRGIGQGPSTDAPAASAPAPPGGDKGVPQAVQALESSSGTPSAQPK